MIAVPSVEFRRAHEQQAQLCDEADEVELRRDFADSDVEHFIHDFANSTGDAEMWLQDQGVDKTCIATAEMLRVMCQSWLINPLAVYQVAGIAFYREVKKLAYEVWSSQ